MEPGLFLFRFGRFEKKKADLSIGFESPVSRHRLRKKSPSGLTVASAPDVR